MKKLLLIDGNSIMNRAFYGIMGNKMLMTNDGKYTNAIYGFLAIMFKAKEDISPEYMAVAFDLKAPTARHKMYEGYKANRKGMPEELSMQMPIIKDVLRAMNITIIEKEGYEGDDILGTLAKRGEREGLDVTILSGDRDTFQLTSDKITIRIPRTKMGKTEIDNFDKAKVIENYGVMPESLIDVKGLMGDSSDNIPGVPGIGEKTALLLIKEYRTIENLYEKLEKNEAISIKGKTKEKLLEHKGLAILSKELGTINVEVPIEEKIDSLEIKEWNKKETFELFKKLNFNRYIEKYNLGSQEESGENYQNIDIEETNNLSNIVSFIETTQKLIYFFNTSKSNNENLIIKEKIENVGIYDFKQNKVYYINFNENIEAFKQIFENENIEKIGYKMSNDYILLKQNFIDIKNITYDVEIAAYILNSADKYTMENIALKYLNIDIKEYIDKNCKQEETQQMTLFEDLDKKDDLYNQNKLKTCMYAYCIYKLSEVTKAKMKQEGSYNLFKTIDMPIVEILGDMQYEGVYIDKEELMSFGNELKEQIEQISNEIYELCGENFNINSPKQLRRNFV